jgi:hypothetical protein
VIEAEDESPKVKKLGVTGGLRNVQNDLCGEQLWGQVRRTDEKPNLATYKFFGSP